MTVTPKTRYVCYNKTRHPEKCDGQTGYTTSKLDEAERNVAQKRVIVESLEQELENSKDTMRQVTRQYNDVLTWSDIYAESEMDVKKMIVSQLISAVRVSKDYKIEIDFKISERQLGLEQEAEKTPKQKKRSEPEI